MQDLNDKVTGGNLTADEWNQVPSEIQNVIENTGQSLSGVDLNQLGKGIADYVANGDFYTDSGVADAYVLTSIGIKQSPTAYTDGMRLVYRAGNANTGASTVNAATLGVKNIFFDGAALVGGEIPVGSIVTLIYDSANGRFDLIPELSNLYSDGTKIGIGTVPTQWLLHIHEPTSGGNYIHMTNLTTGITNNDGSFVGISSMEELDIIQKENNLIRFATTNIIRLNIAGDGGIYTEGATGGSQGVDTINASAYYLNGAKIASPTTVSGWIASTVIQVSDDEPASSISFNVASTVLTGIWKSVGPTGSGADHIWTGMDSVPTSAKYVILKIDNNFVSGTTSGVSYGVTVYLRKTGSTVVLGQTSRVSSTILLNRSGLSERAGNIIGTLVPIDSNQRFDIQWSNNSGGTVNLDLALIGWGE